MVRQGEDAAEGPGGPRLETARRAEESEGGPAGGSPAGVGMADVVHRRFLKAVKRRPTYQNCLTSSRKDSIRSHLDIFSFKHIIEPRFHSHMKRWRAPRVRSIGSGKFRAISQLKREAKLKHQKR